MLYHVVSCGIMYYWQGYTRASQPSLGSWPNSAPADRASSVEWVVRTKCKSFRSPLRALATSLGSQVLSLNLYPQVACNFHNHPTSNEKYSADDVTFQNVYRVYVLFTFAVDKRFRLPWHCSTFGRATTHVRAPHQSSQRPLHAAW